MDWREHIVSDPEVLLGKPTIKGTRISVEFLIDLLAEGWKEEEILEQYPRLSKEDLQAVFAYIRECIREGLIDDLPERSTG
jgi:uncharacterized protein (DUF433 family)